MKKHRDRPLVAAESNLRRFGDALPLTARRSVRGVAARDDLLLNALNELAVLDRHGRDAGERDRVEIVL
jgi:hypothetical protein